MRIVYVPLEPYSSRYTLQLREWNEREFKRLNVNYCVVEGEMLTLNKQINIGVVLDAHTRSYFALSQCMRLIDMHYAGQLTADDFIYFEDMFHPGIEALAYCFDLQFYADKKQLPRIGVRCLAQTIDPDDFVHYTGISPWMRHYEKMVNEFVNVIFINSEEMLPFMTAAGWNVPVKVTGLPFGKQEVLERAGYRLVESETGAYNKDFIDVADRPMRVSFASRIAGEKQPDFFLAVIAEYNKRYGKHHTIFEILSGGKISHSEIDRAVISGLVEVYPNLSKEEYYEHLLNTRVLFNCSLQDWGSVVLPEADTLGAAVLFPAYHSFPEIFGNDEDRMYIPWSVTDAAVKLFDLVNYGNDKIGEISDYQDRTIERTVNIIKDMMSEEEFNFDNPLDISYRKRITNQALLRNIR